MKCRYTCPLCEAMCGLVVEHDGTRVLKIVGDEDDPLSRGHICPKGAALKELHEDKDRKKRPLKKVDGVWLEIEWDQALDEVATRFNEIRARHGDDAVGVYLGNPTVHSTGALLYAPDLLGALRTKNVFTPSSADQLPHHLAGQQMFGHRMLMPVPDLERTELFICMGGNPLVSNGSLMTAPGMKRRLLEIQSRGRVVVVDPRKTRTAELADEHLFVRPGTDALLLAAWIRRFFDEGWVDLKHLASSTVGLEALKDVTRVFDDERVARVTGVPVERIRALAEEIHDVERCAVYGRIGLCTTRFGGLALWLLNALNAISGHLDTEGGMMFALPAVDPVRFSSPGRFGRYQTRAKFEGQTLREFAGELPVAALAQEIEAPGDRQIRALLTHAGNPVLSTPSGDKVGRALEGLEFMVSIDPWINETTRHADYILPPSGHLERAHYDIAFHALAVRNTARFCEPVFERPDFARHEWEIMAGLTRRLRSKRAWQKRAIARARGKLGPVRQIDLALRTGPHKLSINKIKRANNVVDLGPLTSVFPDRLTTRDGAFHLAPQVFLDDMPRLTAELERTDDDALVLIGRRQLRGCNSWMHNAPMLMKGKDRCTLWMHPRDAANRGLNGGDRVNVRSDAGEVTAPMELDEDIMPGVVSLPHGFGHSGDGLQVAVASENAGVNINVLTDNRTADLLSGNAVFNGRARRRRGGV